MNRIIQLFERKPSGILNIYITAGYPGLEDTVPLITSLAGSGVDMVEIGIPFSDPIADGPTIQQSSMKALENGMRLSYLLGQLKGIREKVDIPLLLMGYLNPVLQYGMESFCEKAAEIGIDGLILPDLPIWEYESKYKKALFDRHGLSNIFLISPQTSEDRIRKIDELTEGFIYMVSTDSTTGRTEGISEKQKAYFERVASMNLRNPRLIGFGIHDHATFQTACSHANGAIIGSAFIKSLGGTPNYIQNVPKFVAALRG